MGPRPLGLTSGQEERMGAIEEEQSSAPDLNPPDLNPGARGAPPIPAERKGLSLRPVTLPHLMPKVSQDPEITLTLQRKGRSTTGPESQPENGVCTLARHSVIRKLQKCKVL